MNTAIVQPRMYFQKLLPPITSDCIDICTRLLCQLAALEMLGTMNTFLYAWHKRNTSFCTARQNVLIWSRPDVIISKINRPMTSSRFTAWLPRTLVSRSLRCFVVCVCRSSDASKSKSKLQLEEGLQAARAAKLSQESGEGTSSAVRTDDVGDSSLSQLIAMHEDTFDTDDETVDPSFDLDSSVRSNSDHSVHKKVISPTEGFLKYSNYVPDFHFL